MDAVIEEGDEEQGTPVALGTRLYLRLVLDLVGGLLELADLPYDVRDLCRGKTQRVFMAQPSPGELIPEPRRAGPPAQHNARAFCLLQTLGTSPGVCRGHVAAGAVQVKAEGTQSWPQPRPPSLPHTATPAGWSTHHPHFGEVHQAILGVVWGALLDERQVSQVHAQVGDTRRVTTSGGSQKEMRKKTGRKLWSLGRGRGEGDSSAVSRIGRILPNVGRLSQERLLISWASSVPAQQDKQDLWLCTSQSHGMQEMS